MPGGLRIERARGAPVRPEELSDEDGEILVRLARRAVEAYLREKRLIEPPPGLPERLLRPGAAFVTIESLGEGRGRELRGCIGAVAPVEPLARTVVRVAVDAATADPRFPPLEPGELESVVFEVTVLGPLEELPRDPEGRLRSVKIGVHGLVVEKPPQAGLLLPQVAVDEGWNEHLFLTWTCIKAGLPGTCWLDPEVRVYRFTAAIWRELEPGGRVERRALEPPG